MFLCLLFVTSFPLLLPSADVLDGPPLSTTPSARSPTIENNPITPVPTYALATFDERLSSLSAERTAHPGCTFIKELEIPKPHPQALTDTSPERVPRPPVEVIDNTSYNNGKGCSIVTAVTVYRRLSTLSTATPMAPPAAIWSRRTRPVEPTVYEL